MSDLAWLRSLLLREVWLSEMSPLAGVAVLLDDETLKRLAGAVVVLSSLENSEVLAAVDSTAEFTVFVEGGSSAAASLVVRVWQAVAAADSHFLLSFDFSSGGARVSGRVRSG